MKILVTRPLEGEIAHRDMGRLVVYRPELASSSTQLLLSALCEHRPEVLLGEPVFEEPLIAAWREASNGRPIAIIGRDSALASQSSLAARYGVELLGVPANECLKDSDFAALRQAESFITRHRVRPRLSAAGLSAHPDQVRRGRRVALAGAGIVNLLTAYELVRQGYEVTVLEAMAPPATKPDWRLLGATRGGGDARMFCLTEADNYNEKGSLLYSDMRTVMRQRVSEGGWLMDDLDRLTPGARQWIDAFNSIPPWLAEVFTQDIYAVNRECLGLWEEMRTQSSELFTDVGYVDGILRIYYEEEACEAAFRLQRRVGALKRELRGAEVGVHHPAFRWACESGQIVGGIDAVGFTVNIHRFVARLEAYLEARGVVFRWNTRVTGLERDAEGRITGLSTSNGVVHADHYVVSPGAYGRSCLAGTLTEGKVQGILGLWLTLPNLEPRLTHSVKLHREGHVGEDSNITLASDEHGRPILLLGSGYGFLGEGDLDMGSPEIAVLFEALEDTARRYLPAAYSAALADGSLHASRRACVRPFTVTGLGILEVAGTADGGRLVITTGHNTGGFTQSPAVARAVAATLGGQLHPMQEQFDPERGFWN